MNRESFKLVMAIGVLINSALYLGGVLVVALVTVRPLVWRFDLAAIGVTYLSYLCHTTSLRDGDRPSWWAPVFAYASILFGVTAGVALLWS